MEFHERLYAFEVSPIGLGMQWAKEGSSFFLRSRAGANIVLNTERAVRSAQPFFSRKISV